MPVSWMPVSPRAFLPLIIVVGWGLLAMGCSTTIETDDVEPTFELPDNWHHSIDDGDPVDEQWCNDFGDPYLATLIDDVYEHNLDLRIARARIDEARALRRQSRSQRLPSLDAEAEVDGEFSTQSRNVDFEIGVPASYEVDLWGRLRAEDSAALRELQAASADVAALKMSLAAETAELYYEVGRLRTEIQLLDDQIEVAQTFQELTELRQAQGMAGAIDIVQQEQQIEELHEQRRRALLNKSLTLNAISTLLGHPPGLTRMPQAQDLPEHPPPIADALPAELLERRPDVHAARLRVVAAHDRFDAALRDRLPRLQLSAGPALMASNITELFDFLFVTTVGTLTQSIWSGGHRRARVDEEYAVTEQALLHYSSTLLDAIREVEDTLVRGQALSEILDIQRSQLDAAEEALDLAREQYRAGMLDYLRVLTALQSVQQLEIATLESRQQLLSQRIQLCRVTGGPWPLDDDELISDDPDSPSPENDDHE